MSSHQIKKSGSTVADYFKFDINALEKQLEIKNEIYWQNAGEKKALVVFHQAAKRVPAYKDFLKKHQINPNKIITITDFKSVPTTDKKNYTSAYPLNLRSWDGKLSTNKITASSSGTSGNPNYWPRSGEQEYEAAVVHELLYKNFFNIAKKHSLIIIGFPMGVYVSGMATVLPSWMVAQKYNATILSVGNNKPEVLKAIKTLSNFYEQIIFIGHPFFIKDVLETGKSEHINWGKLNLKVMFCSEGFSEIWRERVLENAGIKNKIGSSLSTYGSSEMLLMAYETPISIVLKELAENNSEIRKKLFSREHSPSIFQYNPTSRYIEEIKKELIFTSQSGIPLIRFNMHDSGVVVSFSKAADTINKNSPTWKGKIKNWPIWQLPLVALWGRSDHTIIFYAANIYPEHIHAALHQKQFLNKLTGKFTMHKGLYKNFDESLKINIELRPKIRITGSLTKEIREIIFNKLKQINSEFADANSRFGKKTIPKIKLWTYQHPYYFKVGLKPKYIQKTNA